MNRLSIVEEFTDSPGARYYEDGPFSGQEFLEKLLEPKFLLSIDNGNILIVNIDGVWGYPSSFISGSFGLLSQKYGAEKVLKNLEIESESSVLRDRIISIINSPEEAK